MLYYIVHDCMTMFMQITREVYGMVKTIELIPNGSQVNVTLQNK